MTFNKEKKNAKELLDKAMFEWNEFDMINKKITGRSMNETRERAQNFATNEELGNKIRISFDVNINKTRNIISYNIVAKNRRDEVKFHLGNK